MGNLETVLLILNKFQIIFKIFLEYFLRIYGELWKSSVWFKKFNFRLIVVKVFGNTFLDFSLMPYHLKDSFKTDNREGRKRRRGRERSREREREISSTMCTFTLARTYKTSSLTHVFNSKMVQGRKWDTRRELRVAKEGFIFGSSMTFTSSQERKASAEEE